MARLAIFDVDHTITRRSTGRRLVQCGIRHGLFSAGSLLSLPYHYLRYRAGKINIERAIAALGRLEGCCRDDLVTVAVDCYHRRVAADIIDAARSAIDRHRDAEDTIVLATSSLSLIVAPLADHLHAEHLIATELEFRDGLATGFLDGGPCLGDEKRRRVEALASSLGADLSDAWFYSDSHLDLPLFDAVGHPVAVNPDRRLGRIARERGWPVERFR